MGEYRTHCCDYIGGFAARKISKLCTWSKSNLLVVKNTDHQLINFKDRFGLSCPSNSVSEVCKITENVIRQEIVHGLFKHRNMLLFLTSKVMTCVITQYPEVLRSCQCTCKSPYDLYRSVVICYCRVRLKYLAKCKNQDLKCKRLRSKLTKLVLFSHH